MLTDAILICGRKGLCLAPERGLIHLLEYQESVVSDRPGVREMPDSGISEGSRENPGTDDYCIIRESPARMYILA